jgi:hypothetical protein
MADSAPINSPINSNDEDVNKGVVESDPRDPDGRSSQVSIEGQLGHRDQDPMLKDSDTDFPEPDALEEHTGEEGS